MAIDRELLAAWRNGDAAAAEALFERHFDGLYRFFRNKAPAAADDLVQRTLLACFESRDRFRGDCSFRTYLFAIARNQLLAHLAKQRGVERIAPERDSVAASQLSPSSAMRHRREHALVLQALRNLPVDDQILLELFYWEQQTGAELGVVLGLAEGTVRTRLRRARQSLRAQIEALEGLPELVRSTITNLDDWAKEVREAVEPRPEKE